MSYIRTFVVSHIQRIGCQPENNYFTRWPSRLLVVCWIGKKKKKKRVWQRTPPRPPRCSFGVKKITRRIYMSRRYAGRRYAGLGPSRVRTRIASTRRLGQWLSLRKFYASVCDNNFPSLVAFLFSWRCLAASSSSSFHAAMNLRPLFVTASTHTAAFNAIAFQPPVMPNARMSLCTQSVHSFSFPPRSLRTAPSRFPNIIHFGSRPPLIRMRVPAHKKSFFSCATLSQCSRTRLSQGHGCKRSSGGLVWSLALHPDDAKQDPVVYRAEFGVVFLAEGLRTIASIQEGLECLGLYHSGLEGERDFRLVEELP